MKIRGNTVGTTMPRPDWNQTNPAKADYIKNKPDLSHSEIICNATGESILLTDSAEQKLRDLKLYGKSTQDGTPTPENPVDIVSAGRDGNIGVTVCGKNLANPWGVQGLEWGSVIDGSVELLDIGESSIKLKVVGKIHSVNMPIAKPIKAVTASFTIISSDSAAWNFSLRTVGNAMYGMTQASGNTIVFNDTGEKNIGNIQFSPAAGGYIPTGTELTITGYVHEGANQTEQTPFVKPSFCTIPTPNGLPGIKVASGGNWTDSTGQQWVCDEVDFARGVKVQRIGTKVYNTLNYISQNTPRTWQFELGTITDAYHGNVALSLDKLVCNYLPVNNSIWSNEGTGILMNVRNIIIGMPGYTTDEVKAWFAQKNTEGNPLTVNYVLATPIETPLTEEEMAQYAELHTNYPVTTIFNNESAGMEVSYVADTKNYIDKKFTELAAAIVANP